MLAGACVCMCLFGGVVVTMTAGAARGFLRVTIKGAGGLKGPGQLPSAHPEPKIQLSPTEEAEGIF